MNYSLETTFTWRFASCHSGGCLFACLFVPTVGKTKTDSATKTPSKILFLSYTLKQRTQFRKLFDLYVMLSSELPVGLP
jgi:hypothetical protein